MSNDFDDELDDDAIVDPGGVPAALNARAVAPGYRGQSRLVGLAVLAVVLVITIFGMWALSHQRAVAATPVAAQPLALSYSTDTTNPVPDPSVTPLTHPAPRRFFVAPTAGPTVQPAPPPPAPEPVQQQSGGGSGAAPAPVVTPTKSAAQLEAEQRAQIIADAAHSSGRMALAAPEGARTRSATVADDSPGRDGAGAPEVPHAGFMAEHSSPVGYDAPTSAFEITETTIIQARLVTAVDSTLPGIVKAQVTTPVYDSRTHSVVVIPAGSLLVGRYDSQTIAGEARLLAVYTRILFPDGSRFEMGANEGAGAKGEAGMPGSVDFHTGRAFGAALGYVLLDSLGNVISNSVNRNRQLISVSTATQTVQPQKQAVPTFHLYPGSSFNVVVARDLPLTEYRAR